MCLVVYEVQSYKIKARKQIIFFVCDYPAMINKFSFRNKREKSEESCTFVGRKLKEHRNENISKQQYQEIGCLYH